MHDATWCHKLEADLVAQKTMGISENYNLESLECNHNYDVSVEHLSMYFKIVPNSHIVL